MNPTIKYNARGGQGSPLPPVPGVNPLFPAATPEEVEEDYEVACRAANDVAEDNSLDWLFDLLDADPDPGPVIEPLIKANEALGMTRSQAQARLVGMDSPGLVKQAIINYANAEGLEIAKKFRLEEPGSKHDDFVTRLFFAETYLTEGLDYAMHILFAEKLQQQILLGKGTRPEIRAAEAGVCPARSTAYPEGCPPFEDRFQGHVTFWEFIFERACQFYNGDGVDALFRNTAKHGGAYRIMAFVHGLSSAKAQIGIRAAKGEFDFAHPLIDNYRINGVYE